MPTVPRYDQPQVQEQGLPGVRVSTDAPIEAFGGGASSAAVFKAGNEIQDQAQKLLQEEKSKADDLATQEAWSKTVKFKNTLVYDPKTGAMTRKGKDAFGAPDEYGQQFDKFADELESSLANDNQRQMYRKIKLQQRADLDQDLQKHVFKEAQQFDSETTDSGLKVAREDAILNYQNPAKVSQSIALQQALVQSHAARQGLPPEWVKSKLDEVSSQTHSQIVSRMLANGQDQLASQYYSANKGGVRGSDAIQLERALEEGTIRGESQRQSDQIYRSHAGSMTEALEAARKIQDPKLRDATLDRVKSRFQEQKQAEQTDIEDLHRRAASTIDQSGTIDQIPAEDWSRFSLSERSALKSYAENRRQGRQPETDWNKYYELMTLASSSQTKDQFLQDNLMAYRPFLADAQFKELIDVQTSLRKNDGKGDKVLDGFRTDQGIVNDTLNSAGIDPTPKPGSEAAAKVNLFRSKVDEQIRDLQAKTGKKATSEDVQRIADNLMIEGVTKKGWLWDTKKRVFELEDGEQVELSPKKIPRLERAKIEDALKRRGIPVSDDKVMALYARKMGSQVRNGD